MSQQRNLILITLVVLVGLFFGGSYFYKKSQSDKNLAKAQQNQNILIRDYSPSIGSPMARITLVEFLDPECESCRRFHPLVKDILKQYDGRIRYVVRFATFHNNSELAVKLLDGARKQGKFWETLDLFFEKLPEWGDHHDPKPEKLWGYLEELNLDTDIIKAELNNKEVLAMLEQEEKDLAAFGVRGTPTFFVNGKPLPSFGVEPLMAAIKKAAE